MRKFFALLLFIIMVFPLLFAAQLTAGVSNWALDRDFYLEAVDQHEVFESLADGELIAQLMSENLYLPDSFDINQLSLLIKSAVTTEYINEHVNNFINGYFDYIQGKEADFDPTLDLIPIKNALSGPQQDQFIQVLVEGLPTCALGQMPAITDSLQDVCKPAGTPDNIMINQFIKPSLPAIIAQIPDELHIKDMVPELDTTLYWRPFIPGMAIPSVFILGMITLIFIAIVAWYLTALIADASWHSRLQWLGWMLIIPSFLVFAIGFAIPSSISAYWINFGIDRASLEGLSYGPLLIELIKTTSTAMLPRIGNVFQMVGGVCGAFSLAFIFWGVATPQKRKESIN